MLHVALTAHTKESVRTARRRVSHLPSIKFICIERKRGHFNQTFVSVYLDRVASGYTSWPVRPLVDEIPDIENITEALTHGPYGKCVYESDNDVCDNQVCSDSPMTHNCPQVGPLIIHTLSEGSQPPIRIRCNRLFHHGRLYHLDL